MNNLIENFTQADVLLIGDLMLDRFVYGGVSRLSPEGPIPVLAVDHENEMLGGAGNVLANMLALGCKCDIISVIGRDAAGDKIKSLIPKSEGLIEEANRPTILKTRFIAQNQQLLRVDRERAVPIAENTQTEILQKARTLIKKKKCLVLSDYGKGVLTIDLVRALIKLAQDNNVTVIVDPKGKDFSKYAGADIITPNKKELSEATNNAATASDKDIELAAQHLIKQHNIKSVIATRSEDGISVIGEQPPLHLTTKVREVYDVSGAGDTVVATITATLAAGGTLTQAAELANIAGGLVVAKVGTAIITQEELHTALNNTSQSSSSFIAPVLDKESALQQIQKWQADGVKVGLTNGCFDIIHYGHVNYLARARERCDKLIVALNHDTSVRILKGESRPVNDEKARATVMAALGSCDMVVLFGATKEGDDNTPCALVEVLKPDIFFKGGDYTIDQLPEGKIVLSYGGQVDIMPLYDGYSTTNIIEKSSQ